ncbi:hypothetical protein [Macrococcus lamae]|uniref:Uncharacterized protein n=1 Tax=Macrococcus lamae TaxID=198484 RepID=A0A4V3BF34_9STAP|nr:hypothetical protein [Macrococcus lamae]TDM07876.1 hypothetical protein ERX29_07430 [Macrococcus lamae]
MKQLIVLVLCLTVFLAACSNEPKTESKKSSSPKVEVKVNKADEAKKKIEAAKERGRKKSDKTIEEDKFDTEKYNQARLCLTDTSMAGTKDCTRIENSEEYSRAWNNLTNEGYICQSGHCAQVQKSEEPSTEAVTVEPATEAPATEAPSTEAVTEQPPVEEASTESPIDPSGLSTEAPIPDVAP